MKLTKRERIGALQLIPGVGRTVERNSGKRRMILLALGLAAALAAADAAGAETPAPWDSPHVEAAAAALRHVWQVKHFCQQWQRPCCLTVAGGAPPGLLIAQLSDIPGLRPLIPDGDLAESTCGLFGADVSAIKLTSAKQASVEVALSGGGSMEVCEVLLRRDGKGWAAAAKQKACVHFQVGP
jgi:hypothetical protein